MIGDKNIFTDDDLKSNFGEEYLFARQYLDTFNYDKFGSLNVALIDNKYTFTHDLQKMLLVKDGQKRESLEKIHQSLMLVNKIYSNYSQLTNHQHYGLLVAFVYFAVRRKNPLSEKELNAFASWVCENFVYEIAQKNSDNIIAMYDNIIEKRYKEIFISMDFKKKYEPTYNAIKGVVDNINTEQKLKDKIKLCAVRIDQFKKGYSYKLD